MSDGYGREGVGYFMHAQLTVADKATDLLAMLAVWLLLMFLGFIVVMVWNIHTKVTRAVEILEMDVVEDDEDADEGEQEPRT